MLRRRLAIFAILVGCLMADVQAVTVTRVTVATTATLLWTAPASGTGRVLVRNPSTVSVYVGGAAVTTATGFEIVSGDAVSIDLSYGDQLYGIVAAATQVVHTIQGSNP